MVDVLNIKLRRDLVRSRGMLLAVVSIIAAGIGGFVGMLTACRNLADARRDYYASCRMADFWVDLKKAPAAAALRAAAVPGVSIAQTRIAFPVVMDLPGEALPVGGIVVALPATPTPILNNIIIRSGSYFTGQRRNEVIVLQKFARIWNIAPGDTIEVVMNGQRKSLFVAGLAIGPEFIYVSDSRSFGVFFIRRDYAEEIFNFRGACNQVVGTFTPAGAAQPTAVLRELDHRLAGYGVFAVTSRAQQFSNLNVSAEMSGLQTMAALFPLLFLSVAAMVLNVLMSRMAEQQRIVVGTLKALGYGNAALFRHFLAFGLVVGVAGGVVGCGLGYWIAGAMNGMYRPVFDFPRLRNGIRLGYMGAAMLIALACAVLGTLRGVRRITRLEPAEAMREPAPPAGGKILIERWTAFWRGLDFRWQIVLRSVFRNPARTAIGIVAATFGAATVCMAFGFVNSMSSMIAFQFDRVTRADYRIALKNEVGLDAVRTLRHLAGSARVEPVLDISGTFANGWRSKKGAITGLTEGSRLTVPSEINGQAVPLPARGLLMTRRLALELGLRPGDCVEFTPVKGLRRTLRLPVVKLVDSTLGLSVYAEIGYLCRLLGMEPAANSLLVKTQQSPAQRRSFLHALKTLPALQSADDNRAQRRRITAQFDDSMKGFAVAMIIFAAVIFFGSILNSSLIALEERRREIATFRVLGYQPAEIGAMFLRENLIVNMSGAGLGLPLGWFLLAGMTTQYSNDVYCMPTVIGGASYAYTLALALLFILASQWVIRRQILKLNWSEALSMKE